MNTTSVLEKMIKEAVEIREFGSLDRALRMLNYVNAKADNENNPILYCQSLEQALICHQLLAERGNPDFLKVMLIRTMDGLKTTLAHPETRKWQPIFYYRKGIAHFLDEDYVEAAANFGEALAGIKEDSQQYPEFASYLGVSKCLIGHEDGLVDLSKAFISLQALKEIPPPTGFETKHGKVVECGIHMRFALAASYMDNYTLLSRSMLEAKALAEELLSQNHPLRMEQFRRLADKLKWE